MVRFDESLERLAQLTSAPKLFSATREEDGEYAFHPSQSTPPSFREATSHTLSRNPDADEIRIQSGEQGGEFLDRPRRLCGFQSALCLIQRTARVTGASETIDFGNLRFDFVLRDNSVINHHHLSYGQKRLFSFYYYLACNPTVVVADELVNGMHHDWIEACLDDLGDRQSFLTSQNPLLLDYLSFESASEVQSSFVLCRNDEQGDHDQLTWENMSSDDAQGFFDAYQVGLQHVSEILRTRGLW
ncbi:ATP-binding protein [Corallococcus sicarius]|uniref:ATP-binding protein n=2 Tax=Corallococcus sicarius TaxID=2316726 RepID=A0A3A8NSP7_9BACT|nr:ATP-binding protein [Corallococcus sicarius]